MDDPARSQAETAVIGAAAHPSAQPSHQSTSVPEEGRFVAGTLVAGRYRIISLLGSGGMGEVYRATDLTLAQPVALKFLAGSGPESRRMLERFHNEVRVARQVSHPNVCRVYDVGEADGVPYISMEYVDGEDLASLLQRIGRLPAGKALEIARKICAGVAAAHDKGVIHRDLKPANIMLDKRGNVVIMDFGLAAIAAQLFGVEARSGTPAYMAPEQLRGEEVTARSDIYALGLVLYEVFTGKRAYEGGSAAELIRLQENAQIVSMSSIAAEIDPAVEKAVRRCLDPVPARRPATALSVAAALPGGDPLAAALAAGETPSPELVAASGKTEGLALKISLPLVLGLAALIIAVPFVRTNVELHSFVPMDLSADTLAEKIREQAAQFGYRAAPADRKYDLHWAWDEVWATRKNTESRQERRRWFEAEPPLQLGYRESPLPLIAEPDGEVTEERPAPVVSGMIEAWVNSKGELRKFRAVPPQVDAATTSQAIDPQMISRAVGFDLSKWQETAPRYTPLYAFDWLKAWKGRHPTLPLDVTVQASAWRGRITEVEVIWPWTNAGRVPESRESSSDNSRLALIEKATSGLVILFSVFLAVRNLRAGRGDRRGAARLASAVFVLQALAWVWRAHWTTDIGTLEAFAVNAAGWVSAAALIWFLYIGLEPEVRARWPKSIVAWSRVLAGRWQDPLVGADVLWGALLGVAIVALFVGTNWWGVLQGHLSPTAHADAGANTRYWIADILQRANSAVEFGLLVVFAIFCLRAILRKDWLASIAAAILFTAQEGEVWQGHSISSFAFYLLIFTALTFGLLRRGLVSSMVAIFFANILLSTPGAQTLSKPYEWTVVAYPALALAIVVWAFWRTSGHRLLEAKPETSLSQAAM
ncbi:MAG: serine/threonine-protein kinase [Bryobacteraceae bacterium]|jgi:serine/threonine-protein kinase